MIKTVITVNNMDFEIKEVHCSYTQGKSHYTKYYKEHDYMGTLVYGSNFKVITHKLERLYKKGIISNEPTAIYKHRDIAEDLEEVAPF